VKEYKQFPEVSWFNPLLLVGFSLGFMNLHYFNEIVHLYIYS
jgi:hypothetical protein